MIEVHELTKRYGDKVAVDNVSFRIEPGRVTGFLGPNGAGKSTTMRMILGLDHPTSGVALVNGRRYVDDPAPLHAVGALLEAKAVHPGRSAFQHLRAVAATHRIPRARVDAVIEMTGLEDVARRRVGGFSLGMGQRLGIATALLGDPQTVVLDEPVNGLDPEGVKWVRTMTRTLADEGRTIFLSSHLMSEMSLTADDLIVIGRGRIVAQAPVQDVIDGTGGASVLVRSPRIDELVPVLQQRGAQPTPLEAGAVTITGLDAATIGDLALEGGIVLHELTPQRRSLEDAFIELTHDDVEYRSSATSEGDQA